VANDRKAFDECHEHTVGENVHFTFPLGSKSSAVGPRSRATGVARLSRKGKVKLGPTRSLRSLLLFRKRHGLECQVAFLEIRSDAAAFGDGASQDLSRQCSLQMSL
jgi:hypothetical protein